VYAGTDPSNALEVVRLVVKEMEKIKEEGITAAEELRVKNQIKGSLILSLESSNSHMSRLARQEMYFGKYLSMDDIIKGVEKVTAEQAQLLAKQLFTRENTSLTILGPLSKTDVPDTVLDV
jgi:predicted Zn-dependent peptidase